MKNFNLKFFISSIFIIFFLFQSEVNAAMLRVGSRPHSTPGIVIYILILILIVVGVIIKENAESSKVSKQMNNFVVSNYKKQDIYLDDIRKRGLENMKLEGEELEKIKLRQKIFGRMADTEYLYNGYGFLKNVYISYRGCGKNIDKYINYVDESLNTRTKTSETSWESPNSAPMAFVSVKIFTKNDEKDLIIHVGIC